MEHLAWARFVHERREVEWKRRIDSALKAREDALYNYGSACTVVAFGRLEGLDTTDANQAMSEWMAKAEAAHAEYKRRVAERDAYRATIPTTEEEARDYLRGLRA